MHLVPGWLESSGVRITNIPTDPIVIDSNMTKVNSVKWNTRGSVLAFAGSQRFQDGKELCTVQFYNTFGHVSTHTHTTTLVRHTSTSHTSIFTHLKSLVATFLL